MKHFVLVLFVLILAGCAGTTEKTAKVVPVPVPTAIHVSDSGAVVDGAPAARVPASVAVPVSAPVVAAMTMAEPMQKTLLAYCP